MTRFPELNDPGLVFVVDGVFSPAQCAAQIARFEREGARLTTDGTPVQTVRHNRRAILFDAPLAASIYDALREVVPPLLAEMRPVGANECLRFYRYDVGDFFKPHQDTDFMRSPLERSLLSVVVYLNDDYDGGALRLHGPERTVAVKTGTAVVFGHRLVHESTPLLRGTKYAVRSDVMYRRA